MNIKYINLIRNFKELDIEDKKKEILNVVYEELRLLYLENKKIDNYNEPLPLLTGYSDEDSYFNLLFTCVMSLREENDKLIEKLKEFSN